MRKNSKGTTASRLNNIETDMFSAGRKLVTTFNNAKTPDIAVIRTSVQCYRVSIQAIRARLKTPAIRKLRKAN